MVRYCGPTTTTSSRDRDPCAGVQSELDELRLPLLTRFAAAPVHGGGSWMSTASALSGIGIGSHSMYWAWKRMAHRYPHLISYLKRHGYYTLAVQPGATWVEDLYGYDDVIIRQDFSYDGFFYGFGHVPDQWSLEYGFTNHWNRNPRPRLLHFFAVSTHFAWDPPPRISEDIAELEEPQPSFIETRPDYVELALTVPQGWKRDYFVTVAYEWELLIEAFRQRVEPGFIALVFGDHQPPFIADGQGDSDVALHVVTGPPRSFGTAGGGRLRNRRRHCLGALRVDEVPDGGRLSVPGESAVRRRRSPPRVQPGRHRGPRTADVVARGMARGRPPVARCAT